MLRKTKNQTINIIQILKNRIAVSLWKQRLAYYTLHLVQSPTSDIGRLTYVSQWLQSSILSQQFFFIYSVLMLDPIQSNGLIHYKYTVYEIVYKHWLLLLLWAAFYGFLGMLKSNKWQTGEAIRKAHMFLINQQIDACLEGSLTPARVACQELLFNIFFFFNTWSKKVQPSKLCLLSRIGSCYDMQCFLDILSNLFLPIYKSYINLINIVHVQVIFLTICGYFSWFLRPSTSSNAAAPLAIGRPIIWPSPNLLTIDDHRWPMITINDQWPSQIILDGHHILAN